MNKYTVFILPICLILSNCATFSTTDTSDSSASQFVTSEPSLQIKHRYQNGYQIENIGSHYAYPTGIQVKSIEDSLQVMGQIIRRTLYKTKHIRGHVDVEVVNTHNQVVKRTIVPLSPTSTHAKHDRSRTFSVLIPGPIPKEYRIRIRHNINSGDH
ncbi:MAG: hypothetical protein VSS75_019055 [Candidatus Parabeggiatoa sp.]|nr:hypothetical protein [Candidatus Parabeggiatoa sp.]